MPMKLKCKDPGDPGQCSILRCDLRSSRRLLSGVLSAVLLASCHHVEAKETNEVTREESGKQKVFNFGGGSPVEFIVALDRHFRTRLVQILTLPEALSRTKVPKLRVEAEDPREVLTLYNRLDSPTLGQWRFEPNVGTQRPADTNLNVLMLVPDKNAVASRKEPGTMKIKGVALAGIPDAKWESLMRDIELAKTQGEEVAAKGLGDAFFGSIRAQRDSKVLIVAGSEAYLEMVESLVSAHRANAEIEAKEAAAIPKAAGAER